MSPATLRPDARIAVVGAGCAGLMLAEELRARGFSSITLFEAAPRAGGKIRSVTYAGPREGGRGLFEAGTVFFIPCAAWDKLLRRYGVPPTRTSMPAVRIADLPGRRICHPLFFSGGFSLFERVRQTVGFLRALERFGPRTDERPGVAALIEPETTLPAGEWFEQQRLTFVRRVLLPIAGGAQFGPLVDQVPAVYVLRLLTMLRRYPLTDQLRLAMPQLAAGHEEVWRRVAATHDVRLGEPVLKVRRGRQVTLETASGEHAFDAVVCACPTDKWLAVADVDEAERSLFERVRSLDRLVLTARVSGLGRDVFYAPRYAEDGVVPPGHPYLFYEVDPGSGLFTFHPYLDGGVDAEDAERSVRELVERLGGEVVEVVHRAIVQGWFPHFGPEDMRAEAYDRLESLQGRRATWYVGELFAGVGVPHGTDYATAVAGRIAGAAPVVVSARERALDVALVGALLAGAIATMTLLWQRPVAATALITGLAGISLLRFRGRDDRALGLTGLLLGPAAEWAATSAGLWRYAAPQLGPLPLWVLPMWWMFPVAIHRLCKALAPEGSFRTGRPLSTLALALAVIAWLCLLGTSRPVVALLGTLGMLALTLRDGWNRAAGIAIALCAVVGPGAELIPIHAGAWSYPSGPLAGLPIWLPTGYAVFGLSLVRLGLSRAEPDALGLKHAAS